MPFVYSKPLRGTIVTSLALIVSIVSSMSEPAHAATTNTLLPVHERKTNGVSTARIVNLGALIGPSVRFVPTALNEKGQIVGYDDRTLTNGNAGAAYLLNADGTFGVLDATGTTPAFFIPTAISNTGNTVAGVTNGTLPSADSGPVTWRLLGGARSLQIYHHNPDYSAGEPALPTVTGIANGTVPVGGADFYGSTSYSATPFKTGGCALSDFFANAANDAGTIVGTAGGYGAVDTLSGCPTYLPGLPRPANASTSFVAVNSSGALIGVFQGPPRLHSAHTILSLTRHTFAFHSRRRSRRRRTSCKRSP